MSCPDCGGEEAVFSVPEPLEEYTPEAALTLALCSNCLRVRPSENPPTEGISGPLAGAIPDGEGGAAVVVLVSLLDSLALNRSAIVDCLEYAERKGVDVQLTLNRLQQEATDPHFDVARRQEQLDSFL
ncbi:hypothetical protein E6P09_04620 [Haloferax mediterranei ATCC 33500]|uniref:Small CPxCG-related zinc finger protein n=1 Tax=Haloferax mediterranei (strain ATCC 33500 / DSM 1411 / JCM 8866 / NBRC 14739 / NCIMB 2177 / R-4) TaxID=523841 RepID=I3R1D5_HALMT|nr:DUF6276 family protein [Haloferax mediterranei]AFK18045.1 hypothetical protein HFX_0306 [Haloferax mediterranei ATCC 33500]AHZ22541.1 hypothetical protein BM92_07720 [Haloferax mediterranei ATCC 33500]EMA02679.1 hypothetical protein C439_08850 [Haloferax mediterranei ATCC 33500]MDX5988137.1 DUF6276 family protein [Haloferax mediterranei ATCC 33500]QCQ74586.1 hypothetical protein E6P09_04620 [Haloferax mediterranei ATCC 33500]